MAVHYQTQGFILTKEDWREADQVFGIYTKDFGKLKILGKAIRKIKSKLRSGAELFYLSEIEFIQGRNYKTLTDAITIEKFKNIRNDLEKLEIIYKITELTDNLIKGQEPDERIFNLLNEAFSKLNTYQLTNLPIYQLIYYYFLWNFLSLLGYQIDLYHCAICQNKLVPKNLYFSFAESGIVCSDCLGKIKSAESIFPETVKILRLFLRKDWNIISRLKISGNHLRELESFSEKYLFLIKDNICYNK